MVWRWPLEFLAGDDWGQLLFLSFSHADLFGRGRSGTPMVHHNADLYVSQLLELVDKLDWKKFFLLGSSMARPSF